MKDGTPPSDSDKKSSSKTIQFPKAKRFTPEEYEPIPVGHPCHGDETPVLCYAWAVQYTGETYRMVCLGCGLFYPMDEVLSEFQSALED